MLIPRSLLVFKLAALVTVIVGTILFFHETSAPNLGRPLKWDCSSTTLPSFHGAQTYNDTKIFIGIFTTKEKAERRQMIRDTYLQYKPENIEYKFVMVANHIPKSLQQEIDDYNDILRINMTRENMNEGKTYEYFRTMAERKEDKFDFVLKADDDSYLHLDRMEYDLSHTNRNMSYWGYLVGDTFMGGLCYGLSFDLVEWIADAPIPRRYKSGHEDSQVQKWFRWSNIDEQVNYEVRNCRIHDYIDSGSFYSKEIELDNTMIVHYLKSDDHFLNTHETLSSTYQSK
ncbi:uncharacterized protein EV154DRAFT_466840 [Mucor mucedo]|uniref:uncharacterized protein n=1 Tax=Mucor mucedo TaxID=29922 RepID=UPI00222106BE|nr:uncharacterized protein EV154DRAFT_466840 [Mucor mucedo]KAI7889683.1 hypothetical protein EV154DRAFT_466840 [Mucor mucedo]